MKKTMLKKLIFALLAALLLTGCSSESGVSGEEGSVRAETVAVSWKNGEKNLIKSSSWAPRVYATADGGLIAGYETESGIMTAISRDNGKTWRDEAVASFRRDKDCANVNFYGFSGALYLAYRATGEEKDGFYTSLQVSVSDDGGKNWRHHSTVCEYIEENRLFKGIWEPYLGEINGRLTCFYSNDHPSVTALQNIESLTWNGEIWTDRRIISNGSDHGSRDGMPVWTRLSGSGYALAIESSRYKAYGHPFVIQLLCSPDGVIWSEPTDVYIPVADGSKAGAPGVAELPDGRLVISFQTDEDAAVKGDEACVLKTVVSDGTPPDKLRVKNFTAAQNVFGTRPGERSVWGGIFYYNYNGCLYAAAGTGTGSALNVLKLF